MYLFYLLCCVLYTAYERDEQEVIQDFGMRDSSFLAALLTTVCTCFTYLTAYFAGELEEQDLIEDFGISNKYHRRRLMKKINS